MFQRSSPEESEFPVILIAALRHVLASATMRCKTGTAELRKVVVDSSKFTGPGLWSANARAHNSLKFADFAGASGLTVCAAAMQ